MKRLLFFLLLVCAYFTESMSQGWPSQYGGVMLQAFYWDSYDDTRWTVLERQADELAGTFDLVWLPQSGNCGGTSMGYDDLYWFSNYNSSFGNEAQLRSLISIFQSKGIKTIADVVINHRRSNNGWFGFPSETYKGVTYSMSSKDVCSDDDGGKAKKEANRLGVELGNADTGEGWDGMRDLDHKGENVQRCVKAYLDFLKNDLGYAGFRYDMVKGYSPSFTGQYNVAAQPEFSVGECWDGTSIIKNWIDGTKVEDAIQSAAFDFQFKYVMRNATDKQDWTWLDKVNDNVSTNWPLISDNTDHGKYRRYAVTFVENHDTQVRNDGSSAGPLKKDTLAANAYMLALPGTPCVFLKHWLDHATPIKTMVAARKQAGINSESSYTTLFSTKTYHASVTMTDDENRLLVALGNVSAVDDLIDEKDWTKVTEGFHYAYYFPTAMNTAYADLPSGKYEGEQQVMLSAVTAADGAKVVYTTDGTTPTATSTAVNSGTSVSISETLTLTAGLLIDGKVSGIVSRKYTIYGPDQPVEVPSFCVVEEGETCAFFEAPATWTETIMCWAWDTQNYTGGRWPGQTCVKLGTATNGNSVWKWTYSGSLTTKPTRIIFSNNGSPQTDDLPFENGGYYTKYGLETVVPVGSPVLEKCATPTIAYEKGKLKFSCETPGVKFVSEVKTSSTTKSTDSEVSLAPIVTTITVRATKAGFDDSDVATATIGWRDSRPVMEGFSSVTLQDDGSSCDVNNDGTVDVADISTIIDEMAKMARMLK
jgi:alpha-amylase